MTAPLSTHGGELMESILEQVCPCCHGPLERIEYVIGQEYGQLRIRPIYCGLRCDLFYDEETKTWRDCQTWGPWNGEELEAS